MTETTAYPPSTRSAHPALLSVEKVGKVFGGRGATTTALRDLSFTIEQGEFASIMGPSGSGKTTLLNCVATIDAVTSGHILLDGQDVTRLRGRELAAFRRNSLGFVFQDANLLDTLTGFENVALALTIKGESARAVTAKVETIADKLGVADVLGKYPHQMSGGQRQRIAAARAIAADPKIVLADEPTGALDSRSANVLLDILTTINRHAHATILMVTHDAFAASFADRVLFMKDGALFNEITRGDMERAAFFDRIIEVVTFLGGGARHAR